MVTRLTPHGLLSEKQYDFRFSKPVADVLTALTEFAYQALDYNGEARVVAPDISKALNRFWHSGLLYMFNGYNVSGRIFDLI